MALHAGCSQSIFRGFCGVIVLSASLEQMSVFLEGTAIVGEVIIQTFGAMDVSMLTLLAFLICREHLFWILS